MCTACGLEGWDPLDHDGDFRLRNNRLTGPIPSELGQLGALDGEFGLDFNSLTGPIPPELGALTDLTRVGLSNNGLCDKVPNSVVALQDDVGDYAVLGGNDLLGLACCEVYPDQGWPCPPVAGEGLSAAAVGLIAAGGVLAVVGLAGGAAGLRKARAAAAARAADDAEMAFGGGKAAGLRDHEAGPMREEEGATSPLVDGAEKVLRAGRHETNYF